MQMEHLKIIAYLCKRETFRPGETIFQRHEQDPSAYLFINGKAGLLLEPGGEFLTEYGENDFIGGLSLFCDMKRLFTMQAITKLTCLRLNREKFQKVLQQFPEISAKMFETLAKSIYVWEATFASEHGLKCPECRSRIGVSLI
jgi:CRP-like cAMP-binding protein